MNIITFIYRISISQSKKARDCLCRFLRPDAPGEILAYLRNSKLRPRSRHLCERPVPPKLQVDLEIPKLSGLILEYIGFSVFATMTSNSACGTGSVMRAGRCTPLFNRRRLGGTTLVHASPSDICAFWALQSLCRRDSSQ